ncbi:PREDICTED: neuronal acetylcholine receptor subunit alpha-9 [Gekko japonicus]|uniref:Neuronal acetylcholine receptor subunit alpha-9 n=1 Tax=Gekko japonicus TaxID=146911 RepID=A0ABM1K0Y9_GEKJA|nr:PREDICTED: neuronal acetylcholine receptor subunit alpha-9 [Gekko japonicus]
MPRQEEIERYLDDTASSLVLDQQHVEMMDEQISLTELIGAIKRLKNNKATGPDGYPSEFYKNFQDILAGHLLDTLNDVLSKGVMPHSWFESTISVIHKENKNPTDPASYRPIALLNHDNKILTSIMANRLKTFITNYISPDQTGFIPGRQITDNIRRTLDIIIHQRTARKETLLLALDFEKAFDSVEIPYIMSLLQKMGFGTNFLRVIKTIYAKNTARIRVNGCAHAAQGKYAQMLFNELFEDYSNALRPVEDTDTVLNVTLQITLSQIKDMDERNQILTAYLWIRQTWHDAYLKWDKDKYDGLDSIRIPSNLVWRPDIVLYNKADDDFSEPVNTNIVLRYDGKITWDAPAITKSSCVVDVSYFPFDSQECNLTFGSWTYNGNQVDIFNILDSGDLSDFIEDVEWEIHGMPAVKNVITYGCCSEPYPDVTFTLILKRKSSFYIFNLLLPCLLISFLAPLGFYLPADSGEKVSLGVTVLLALTVFQLMVAESMPPSENVPLIGKYYIATMTMITASTALTIIIMNIHYCGSGAKPVPQWARVVILDYMSKIFFVYDVGENCTGLQRAEGHGSKLRKADTCPRQEETYEGGRRSLAKVKSNGSDLRKKLSRDVNYGYRVPCENAKDTVSCCSCYRILIKNIEYIANCVRRHKANHAKGVEWKKVAKVMDRFFMWIFFMMVFFMSVLIIGKAL